MSSIVLCVTVSLCDRCVWQRLWRKMDSACHLWLRSDISHHLIPLSLSANFRGSAPWPALRLLCRWYRVCLQHYDLPVHTVIKHQRLKIQSVGMSLEKFNVHATYRKTMCFTVLSEAANLKEAQHILVKENEDWLKTIVGRLWRIQKQSSCICYNSTLPTIVMLGKV